MLQGRNTAAQEHPWSTMVRMASLSPCLGSPVIKSMATHWKGLALLIVGIRKRGIQALWVSILFCWQITHPLTYSVIYWVMYGHEYHSWTFQIVSSCPGWPARGWLWYRFIMPRFTSRIRGTWILLSFSDVVRHFSGGITVMFWLSLFPWSARGGLDRKSDGILVFPGICSSWKSYSWRSACQRAIHRLRFWGDFQYWRFAWSVRMIKGTLVQPR